MSAPQMFDLADVREHVGAYRGSAKPADHPNLWAATALIVAPAGEGPAVAFIQRPVRTGDRWSGQMALPGGRRDPHDADVLETAQREATEEVGVMLPPPAGRLDDVRGRVRRGLIATYVFVLDQQPELHPQPGEVEAALWIPLSTIFSPTAAFRYSWGVGRFPAIRHHEHVVWGLTHRVLASFAEALGLRLPAPS